MNKVTINGKTYTAPDGCSISVINNKVYCDGKLLEDCNEIKQKKIEIIVEGNCKEVSADAGNITVNGNVEGDVAADAGNISIKGNVGGDVHADCGNITTGKIVGNASVDCGTVKNHKGNIKSYNNFFGDDDGLFHSVTQKFTKLF